MLTNSEIADAKLSATKKDYYQIWNELLEIAKKISNRWDPTCTNESDPGIVLLKVLTGVADKLNYNIDKNILEAYMPSAAQMESMRKLCEVLGYNIKYYQSAVTTVTISFKNGATNTWPTDSNDQEIDCLTVPIFTTFSDANDNIHFVTTQSATIQKKISTEIPAIEGQLVQCTSENDNIISINQLDENNRYFLPEAQIAENGIFIQNYDNGAWSEFWDPVDNLNGIQLNKHVFKFGYDSSFGYPYVQFPDDIAQIIQDGLSIYYIRTSGNGGNISAKTLTKLTKPSEWSNYQNLNFESDFVVTNSSATTNGKNLETIEEAYNNFKKTIGTFDTLVTCRDYMNKIYQLIDSENNPIVSNCIVSDIRDDINRSRLLCTYNNQGICYIEDSKKIADGDAFKDAINNFNLVLYPFTTVKGYNMLQDYVNSFKLDPTTFGVIQDKISNIKTISHQFTSPDDSDLALIKVYMKLYVSIITNSKVNAIEQREILNNVKTALYTEFNLRNLDFGEEIPTDKILNTIQYADSRIKTIYLQSSPKLIPVFMVADQNNTEYSLDTTTGQEYYNKTTLRNILAGRVELFNYDTRFAYNFFEEAYEAGNIKPIYPDPKTTKKIVKLHPSCEIDVAHNTYELHPKNIILTANEVIKFRAPNINTIITYPVYINYYFAPDEIKHPGLELEPNIDYQLQDNDILFINYTEKLTSDTTSDTTVVRNICYTAGAIIRPNFTLKDSRNQEGNPGTKKIIGNTNFIKYDENGQKKIPETYESPSSSSDFVNFYTMDTNQQIELRSLTTVNLSGENEKLPIYWTSPDYPTRLPWELTGTSEYEYILNDGEYFYYTDANRTDMAWYGSGTKVILHNINIESLDKNSSESAIDPDSILSNGVSALPWKEINLNTTTYIEIQEYQYINLVEGDQLECIGLKDESTTLDSEWRTISDPTKVKYIINGATNHLPTINIPGIEWEVRSALDINISPNTPQKLIVTEDGEGNSVVTDTIIVEYDSGATDPLCAVDANNPLCLNSNYTIQSSRDDVDTKISAYNISTGLSDDINDFTIKTYADSGFMYYQNGGSIGSSLNAQIHNAGEKWTRVQFETFNLTSANSYFTVATNIPDSSYALIMMYNPTAHDSVTDNPYFTYDSTVVEPIKIFNAKNAITTQINKITEWWDEYKDPAYHTITVTATTFSKLKPALYTRSAGSAPYTYTKVADDATFNNQTTYYQESIETKYYLHPGLNVIQVLGSGVFKIFPDKARKAGATIYGQTSITLSDIDIVKVKETTNTSDYGINNTLIGYYPIDPGATGESQILIDIPKIDILHEFYYNCPIDNSYAINLSDVYKLASPEILFDKNNLNNKFVIAEIDAEHLDVGITIDRASKM